MQLKGSLKLTGLAAAALAVAVIGTMATAVRARRRSILQRRAK